MVIFKARFESFKPLSTKTNLIFSTKEDFDSIVMEQIRASSGFLSFSADMLKKTVEDAMKNRRIGVEYDGKTQSQILRGVLWELGERNPEMTGEIFYDFEMNRIIEHYKEKLLKA